MEFHAFGLFVSVLNFGLMFLLFNFVVIVPMEKAIELRQKKINARLDEIRATLAQAQKLEAEVKGQYVKLDSDKQEMREATEREIARVQKQLAEQSQRDAQHLVAKTQRECEKNRLDTLAALNRQLTDKAMDKVESILSKALDAKAQTSSAELVLNKAVKRAS
jgi:F0F1-type ATP synthase membrane subunit b/b'